MVTSAFARPTASRRTMSPRVVAVLAALAVLLLGGVGPASAHEPLEEPVVLAPTTLPGPDTSIASQAAGSHASSAMPWPILMMVIVGSVALIPRRAPRLVVAALAVVLTVFGVESALHSVHHVFDNNSAVACPTASIAAHLNGTTIEGP